MRAEKDTMPNVLCFGEILVDWIATTIGVDLEQSETFTMSPGGAPANTAICLARQGVKTAFIGCIAQDRFGLWLREVLMREGVDVSGVIENPHTQTRMAYIVTTECGDRKVVAFSKITCADAHIKPTDLKPDMFAHGSIFHFGSITLIDSPSIFATEQAIKFAQEHKMIISYDPNIRLNLWPSKEECQQKILNTLHWAHLVKINEDELVFLTGLNTLDAAKHLREKYKIPLLVVTLAARGAMFVHHSGAKIVRGFEVPYVEATGAGDAFNAGMISQLLSYLNNGKQKTMNKLTLLEALTLPELETIISRANAIGALACSKIGAYSALPTREETDLFLDHVLRSTVN